MRRARLVVIATIAGLAGVLSFHTKPATLSFGHAVGGPRSAWRLSDERTNLHHHRAPPA